MDRVYSGHGLVRQDEVGAILLVGRLARRLPRADTARPTCNRPLYSNVKFAKREIVLAITVGVADQRHG
jgi:hypothetical protein